MKEWIDLLIEFIENSAPIIGVVSILIGLFNKEHSRYEKNKKRYFNDFLVKFYNNYRNNNNMNIRKFYEKNYRYVDNYIPTYVDYLIEKKEYEKLKSILIGDYLHYCVSVENSMKNTLNKIFNTVYFIEYCFVFVSIMIISFFAIRLIPMTIEEIFGRVNGTSYSAIGWIPAPLFFTLMLIILGMMTYIMKYILDKQWIKNDMYTSDEKYIKKLIISKEKRYNKLKNKVYWIEEDKKLSTKRSIRNIIQNRFKITKG